MHLFVGFYALSVLLVVCEHSSRCVRALVQPGCVLARAHAWWLGRYDDVGIHDGLGMKVDLM